MNYILLAFAVLLLVYFFSKKSNTSIEQIDAKELNQLLKEKNHQFIDVRTPGEFATNKIKGFKNIPLASLKNRTHELKTETPIVVLCASGSRSMAAAATLAKLGYKVLNVKGGLSSYKG